MRFKYLWSFVLEYLCTGLTHLVFMTVKNYKLLKNKDLWKSKNIYHYPHNRWLLAFQRNVIVILDITRINTTILSAFSKQSMFIKDYLSFASSLILAILKILFETRRCSRIDKMYIIGEILIHPKGVFVHVKNRKQRDNYWERKAFLSTKDMSMTSICRKLAHELHT